MIDKELLKNGSGYNDPTAYEALKKIQNWGESIMENRTGEIWEVEFGMRTEKVVVIADHGAYSTILKLTDEPRETRTISLPVFGMKYAEPGLVSYKFHESFLSFVRKTTDEEFADITQKIKNALKFTSDCQPDPQATVENYLIDDLRMKLECAERELEELKKQPVFAPDPEEVVRLKAQIEVLERQNERLLDRLIG